MTRLSVNLNKVALLRNQRDLDLPSVEAAARTVLSAGARGVTVHPRPDRRHALAEDVRLLRSVVDEYGAELNVEGYPSADFLRLVAEVAPHQVTLVPDDPAARTSDHGWDMQQDAGLLSDVIPQVRVSGARISLFVDYDAPMAQAQALAVDAIELYTEPYARAFLDGETPQILLQFAQTALDAHNAGMRVHAGHDLNAENLAEFLRNVPQVEEVSIGHAFTAEALWLGMSEATLNYLRIIASHELSDG